MGDAAARPLHWVYNKEELENILKVQRETQRQTERVRERQRETERETDTLAHTTTHHQPNVVTGLSDKQ